jgi:hypothetical protein
MQSPLDRTAMTTSEKLLLRGATSYVAMRKEQISYRLSYTARIAAYKIWAAIRPPIERSQARPLAKCVTREIRNSTKKTMNNIFAMPAEAIATPVKPNTPAINAITKNTKAQ